MLLVWVDQNTSYSQSCEILVCEDVLDVFHITFYRFYCLVIAALCMLRCILHECTNLVADLKYYVPLKWNEL